MRYLLTLLLLTTTAFAQVPDQVEKDLERIEALTESIRSYYDAKDKPESVTASYIEGDLIAIQWDSFESDGVDIEFYSPDIHAEWAHSVNKYLDLHNNPIDSQSGLYTIGGGNPNTDDVSWNIRMRVGEWVSDVVHLTPEVRGPPEAPVELDLFLGYWYSGDVENTGLKELMTVGHTREANYVPMQEIVDSGLKVVPTIGGFSKEDTENELRQRVRDRKGAFDRVGHDNIEYVILRDEPYAKGLSKEQLEIIVDEFQQVFPGLKHTFMFTESGVQKDLPDNLELVGANVYPFYDSYAPQGYPKIFTYEEFSDHLDSVFEGIDKPIVLSPQVFETKEGARNTNPWRMPPTESADWYFLYASENNIVGFLLWMKGELSRWNGITPDLENAWIESTEKWLHEVE